MIYIELPLSESTVDPCATCGEVIQAGQVARLYQLTTRDPFAFMEHGVHPLEPGATRAPQNEKVALYGNRTRY